MCTYMPKPLSPKHVNTLVYGVRLELKVADRAPLLDQELADRPPAYHVGEITLGWFDRRLTLASFNRISSETSEHSPVMRLPSTSALTRTLIPSRSFSSSSIMRVPLLLSPKEFQELPKVRRLLPFLLLLLLFSETFLWAYTVDHSHPRVLKI